MRQRLPGTGRCAVALAACLTLTGAAWAVPSEAARIAELEKKIELLTQRLLQLERGSSPDTRLPPSLASSPAPDSAAARTVAAEPASLPMRMPARPSESGIPIHAFVDAGYARDTPDPAGRKGGFAIGNVALYMTPSFGERVKSIIELVFEQDERGSMVVDLERVQLGYTFSDALTTWVGRYHTPIGYWNAAFHHGAQIQTSVLRPRFLAFEDQGGIVPVHGVGMLGSGSVPLGEGRAKYDLYIANGSPIEDGVLAISGFKDDDGNKMIGGNVRHEFGGNLRGLTVGAHAMSTRVTSYDAQQAIIGRTQLKLGGAYVVFDRGNWDLIGEYYAFRNRDLLGATGAHASWAAFAQVGYTLADTVTPFVRIEKASLDQGDSYFATMNSGRSYRRQTFGVNFELNPTTALKIAHAQTTEVQAGTDVKSNGLRAQVAVRF